MPIHCDLYYKNITLVSYDRKWTIYNNIIVIIASALPLDLASVINYDCKWWHYLEHHLQSSFTIVIYL